MSQNQLVNQLRTIKSRHRIDACCYYNDHQDVVRDIVLDFDPEDAVVVRNAQELIVDENVLQEIAYIANNYRFIIFIIKNLQTAGLSVEQGGNSEGKHCFVNFIDTFLEITYAMFVGGGIKI